MLRCVSPYKSSLGAFQPGDVITDPALATALAYDSPGSFEPGSDAPLAVVFALEEGTEAVEQVAAIEQPVEHRAATRRKAK